MSNDQDPQGLARAAAEVIAERTGVTRHDIAIILGSGWHSALDVIGEPVAEIPAEQVPGFRVPSVDGHSGVVSSTRLPGGRNVLAIGARTHLYEGHGVAPVVHPCELRQRRACRRWSSPMAPAA